jgi:hypothetical protein
MHAGELAWRYFLDEVTWKSSGKIQVKNRGVRECLPIAAAQAMDLFEREQPEC